MRFRPKHLIIVAMLAAAACGGGGSDSPTSPGTTGNGNPGGQTGGPTATNAVTVSNNKFTPANIQVSPGTTVTWTWTQDAVTHNVTFADGASSGDQASGTYSRTFSATGTFNYQCTIHAGMNGSVVVQ